MQNMSYVYLQQSDRWNVEMHGNKNKTTAFLQMTFSSAFSRMDPLGFQIKCHYNTFAWEVWLIDSETLSIWVVAWHRKHKGSTLLAFREIHRWHADSRHKGWVIDYIVWEEITYPFQNYNGAAIEDWEWTSNFISHFTLGSKLNHLIKETHCAIVIL